MIRFLSVFWIFCQTAIAQERLIFAVDLIRHGDRTPVIELSRSPHEWKEGLGNLTEKGKEQERQLGLKFREDYIVRERLLPEKYTEGSLHIRSTDFKRTRESALAVLEGLYPSEKKIPIEVVSKEKDPLLVKPASGLMSSIRMYFWERKAWKEKTSAIQNQIQSWSQITGRSFKNFDDAVLLGDNLYIRSLYQVPFPEGLSLDQAQKIIQFGESSIVDRFKQPDVTDPMGKAFLKKLSEYFRQASHPENKLKYVLFSGHDSSIMAVMNTLHAPLTFNPPYASRLSFKLYQENGQSWVQISLNEVSVLKLSLTQLENLASES